MEIKILTRDVYLSAEREKVIRGKFAKLTRFADRIGDESTEIRVDLAHEESRKKEDAYICILTLFVPQDTLRAESRSNSLETAIDDVLEKIKGPIEYYKNKTRHISERE
ncbi:HPF/RaiA family ribosome-associated protein [Patescibacteria group bacterium]|nr:HPF/RaiA family ribosome-associated protein [Patescibacteria group bacterium]MBU1016083.1 HPF/RaiA family ribosome-associated protein [Patescibacteria group bacterium]MBU1684826.1 HPF/RaiA family ribosome-associated protein [Patescibacteria group bacterium]MBU1938542.1 HPF/RaiA family ribosome-associated protein [Patescibacteria group bacterium]